MRYDNISKSETTHGYVSTAGKVYPPELDVKNNIPLKFRTEHDVYNAEPPEPFSIREKIEKLDDAITSCLNVTENIRHALLGSPNDMAEQKAKLDCVIGVSVESSIDIINNKIIEILNLLGLISRRLG